MKLIFGILAAVIVALGVWLSLTVGRIEPAKQSSDISPEIAAGSIAYSDPAGRYRLTYPQGYIAGPYEYQALGPERAIRGTRFIVPEAVTVGTNLASDTYISVEPLPGAINSCSPEIYLGDPQYQGYIDQGTRRFFIATASGAVAGNRYEETVYATPIDGGCLAVRYFIHYGVLENYPAGSVRAFDRQALMAQFDAIRGSLVVK